MTAINEKKWQDKWDKAGIFKVSENPKKKKFYCLEMFPYPSASFLHMGHVRNYTIGDVIARFKRMQGYNVLYPMGYDSFGLPAENAAKKEGIHPKEYTGKAIKKIMEFQKALGNSYDWSRTISTHEPEYYKWNQYFFLKFLEKELVYKKKASVNWCSKCESTLANEEVVNGYCWRHEDTLAETKELEQWFLKITEYADELLSGLKNLKWSDRIKHLQKNWIGRSEGLLLDFGIKGSKDKLQVFTTRPDTVFGVTFVTVSPKHKLIEKLAKKNKDELEKMSKSVQNQEEKDKEGVFLGSYAINPFTNEEVPIYAGNFVVAEYGTGAVMAVPAHDKRDFEFAKKYNLKINTVIVPENNKNFKATDTAYVDDGILVNSGQFNGLDNNKAIQDISKFAENKKVGKKIIQYKLRDWLISRQRFWGTPIPIIYCDKCGMVPEKDLPVLLPDKVDFKQSGNPLANANDWIQAKCPKCKGKARRETDTMGGFVDSSWYFLRYCSPNEKNSPFDKKAVSYWMPVDQYVGGIEHAVGHLIYSRFWTKALRDMGMLKIDEPFSALFNQGIVYKNGHKMSKSFGNVIYQTDISDKYGIDTARLFVMSVASPESDMEWQDKGVEGSYRLIQRIEKIAELKMDKQNELDEHKLNSTIKNYTLLIEQFKFNTAIIDLIRYVDYLSSHPTKEGYKGLLKMISPFAPHLAEEMWEKIGEKGFISIEPWPKHDEKKISLKLDYTDGMVEKVKADIREVLKLAKIEAPKKITLFLAEEWKHKAASILKEASTRDMGIIMKSLMKDKTVSEHGKEASSLAVSFLKDPSKMPLMLIGRNDELSAFNSSVKSLEEEFNTKVEIIKAENSKENKARQALPGKPAILVY